LSPMPLPQGSLRPANPKGLAVLLHLASFVLFPLIMGMTLFPLGVEYILHSSGWPLYLLLTTIEVPVVMFLYSRLLTVQAMLLQNREQKILEIVTTRTD
jgi:hypothetical protein